MKNDFEEKFKVFLIITNPFYWMYFVIEFINRNVFNNR